MLTAAVLFIPGQFGVNLFIVLLFPRQNKLYIGLNKFFLQLALASLKCTYYIFNKFLYRLVIYSDTIRIAMFSADSIDAPVI